MKFKEIQSNYRSRRRTIKTFYSDVKSGRLNDIVNRAPNFETEEAASKWSATRSRELLKADNDKSVALGHKLENCVVEQCNSACLPR